MSITYPVGSMRKKLPPALSVLEETLAQHILADKLPRPIRQLRYHATRDWRFDFAWPDLRFAVEVQGGVHVVRTQFHKDIQKGAHALLGGWSVLYVSSREVRSGEAIEWVKQALAQRGAA